MAAITYYIFVTIVVVSTCNFSFSQTLPTAEYAGMLDSIRHTFPKDSIDRSITKLDSMLTEFNTGLHGAQNLHTLEIQGALNQLKSRIFGMKESIDTLNKRTINILDRTDSLINTKIRFLDSLAKANGLPSLSRLTQLNIKGADQFLPGTDALQDISLPIEDVLSTEEFTKLNLPSALPGMDLDLKSMESQLDVPSMDPELLNGVEKEIPKDLLDGSFEKLLSNDSKIKSIEKQIKEAEGIKERLKTVEEKEQLKATYQEYANRLENKQEIIQSEMEKIGKVQIRYRDFDDSRKLPKRPPNVMRGKPFVERLIPGIDLYLTSGENVSADVAPLLGFRISGRWRAGLSYFHRYTYFGKEEKVKAVNHYGYRVFQSFRIIKSFYIHLEGERNYVAPPDPALHGISGAVGWKNRLNTGIYQTYSIGKNMNASVVFLYDALQWKRFPNSSGSMVRFGLDYQIKKKSGQPLKLK